MLVDFVDVFAREEVVFVRVSLRVCTCRGAFCDKLVSFRSKGLVKRVVKRGIQAA